jgi:hypothetical protein
MKEQVNQASGDSGENSRRRENREDALRKAADGLSRTRTSTPVNAFK